MKKQKKEKTNKEFNKAIIATTISIILFIYGMKTKNITLLTIMIIIGIYGLIKTKKSWKTYQKKKSTII